jgi:hypothetical protein
MLKHPALLALAMALIPSVVLAGPSPTYASDRKTKPERKLETPIQLAFAAPAQIFRESASVMGIRLSVFLGRNEDVTGLDLGLVNSTKGTFNGLGAGLVNSVHGDGSALHVGAVNSCGGYFSGVQLSGFLNHVGGDSTALQVGAINVVNGTQGGLQIGVINVAKNLNGVQIGLININASSDTVSFMPILNMAF